MYPSSTNLQIFIMNKGILFISLLALSGVNRLSAQNYPSTDASGAKVYYKIASAYPEYSKMCIEDNSLRASGTGYSFLVSEMSENTKQEWELVAAANDESGTYYFRNRGSRRYISSAGSWRENYYTPVAAAVRTTIKPFTIQELDNSQIAIKYNDGTDDRYLFAADSADVQPGFNIYALENSVWAWKVCDASGVPVSVAKILKESNVKIEVVNRVIKVEGVDAYSLYNDEGVRLNNGSVLEPGVYFVSAKGVSRKVLVK